MIRITIRPLWAIIYTAAAIAVCVGLCLVNQLWLRIILVSIVILDKAVLLRQCARELRRINEIISQVIQRRNAKQKGSHGIPIEISMN